MMAMSLQPHTMLLQPFANLEMALSEALRITVVGKESTNDGHSAANGCTEVWYFFI